MSGWVVGWGRVRPLLYAYAVSLSSRHLPQTKVALKADRLETVVLAPEQALHLVCLGVPNGESI